MNYFLSLLAGMLISVAIAMNGSLGQQVGNAFSLVIVHLCGLIAITLLMALRRQKPKKSGLHWVFYTGGLIGIVTVLFNLVAYGRISVSAMMALGLLGESASGLLADHFGILGLPRRPFRPEKLLGIAFILLGIISMLTDFVLLPVLVSFGAGLTVLLSRLINGRLARRSSVSTATFFNYFSGLLGASALFLAGGMQMQTPLGGPLWIYLGGAVGVGIVYISNYVVGKISSFYMTLALFVGQVTVGMLLDKLLLNAFSARTALGGLFVLVGLCINLWQDRAYAARQPTP